LDKCFALALGLSLLLGGATAQAQNQAPANDPAAKPPQAPKKQPVPPPQPPVAKAPQAPAVPPPQAPAVKPPQAPTAPPPQAPTAPPPQAPTAPPPQAPAAPPPQAPVDAPAAEPETTDQPAEEPPADPESGLTPEEEQALRDAEAAQQAEAESSTEGFSEMGPMGSEEISEEIVITGSRISRNKKDQFAQVAVVTDKEIKASGAATIDDLLNKLPSLTLQGLNKQNNNGGNGLAFIDLRNLGTSRTLVLINGRRFISSGESGSGVDMNNIPVAMVERIEVLLDGASAVYGSDAIGGVVNIILKKDFQGVAANVGGGISSHGDGENLTVSTTMGTKTKHGNVALGLSYMRQGVVRQADRDWSKRVVTDEYYLRDADGKLNRVRGYGSWYTAGGLLDIDIGRDDEGNNITDTFYRGRDGWTTIYNEDYSDLNSDFLTTKYNYGARQWLVGKNDRLSLTTFGDYDLSRYATAYMEGMYTYRKSRNSMAPAPLGGGTARYPGTLMVPVTNPYLPSEVIDVLGGNREIYMMRRLVEAGKRITDNTANSFRLVLGLKGEIVKDRLGWDTFVSASRNQNTNIMHNDIDLARMLETLDPAACARNPNCPGLGNYFGAGKLQSSVLDYIKYDDLTDTEWSMIDTGLSLNSKLYKIPFGGWLSAAIGGEFRWESGSNLPSGMVTQGYSAGNLQDPTAGEYNAQEVFGELSIPILKEKIAAYALTLDLAGRVSRYDTFGTAFTYRTGLSWAPIQDVTLRGVYSTAFRAPSIGELYGGAADSYLTVLDPCDGYTDDGSDLAQNCAANGAPDAYVQQSTQIRTNVGSNPNLNSESARFMSAGIVLTPTFIPQKAGDLTVSTDFYFITINRGIGALDAQQIVNLCYNSPNMSHPYCSFIGARNPDGSISGLEANAINLAQVETKGLDFSVSYLVPVWKTNTITLGWDANYLINYDEKNKDVDETDHRAGTIDFNVGSYAKLRQNFSMGFGGENWSYTNRVRYIGKAELYGLDQTKEDLQKQLAAGVITADVYEESLPPTQGVVPIAYWDMVATFNYKGWEFALGVENLLDQDPPFLPEGTQNANQQTYDFMGRYFYTNIGYKL
jgi:outer membrane receptor protein involved in Fe transport